MGVVVVSRLILVTLDDDVITLRCPACGETRQMNTAAFSAHKMFAFYRHHAVGHLSGKR